MCDDLDARSGSHMRNPAHLSDAADIAPKSSTLHKMLNGSQKGQSTVPIDYVLDKVSQSLQDIPGVQAIVLGGSRARGTHSAQSDIDIGIYYDATELDLAQLKKCAHELDDDSRDELIAAPGEWGEWINGGGWLVIGGHHVDLILRETARVATELDNCHVGRVTAHYQPGHPHAYINAMYVGELAISRVLWDGTGEVTRLKSGAEAYPAELKAALVNFFRFEAGFSAMFASANADKADPYYVHAHVTRAVSCLNQVLFALNEQYCINEKKAVQMIDSFPISPAHYQDRIAELFTASVQDLMATCGLLDTLIDETQALIDNQ